MSLLLSEFFQVPGPLFDVRSPCEFDHAHVPGAISLPLFSDEERAIVGTTYKKEGREAAIMQGLRLVGPKIGDMAATLKRHASDVCRVMCFRGGMRSQSVRILAEFLGLQAVQLEGGYKVFRRQVLATFDQPWMLVILGGATGSGKTEYLVQLQEKGYQVIDLEALANHRGSTFGLLPGDKQPSNEHFENLLATELWKMDASQPVFLEDESRLIGSCVIPKGLYEQMDRSQLVWLEVDREKRLDRILEQYATFPLEHLIERATCLKKRLGGERLQKIIQAGLEGRIKDAASDLLDYYDHAYAQSRSSHQRACKVVQEHELFEKIDEL